MCYKPKVLVVAIWWLYKLPKHCRYMSTLNPNIRKYIYSDVHAWYVDNIMQLHGLRTTLNNVMVCFVSFYLVLMQREVSIQHFPKFYLLFEILRKKNFQQSFNKIWWNSLKKKLFRYLNVYKAFQQR